MWIYYQKKRTLYHNNTLISINGYSGKGEGKNLPAAQHLPFIGPCPVGLYSISNAFNDPKHGPVSFHLIPDVNNQMFNRRDFMIHPDSTEYPGATPEDCICQDKDTRLLIKNSEDTILIVVP